MKVGCWNYYEELNTNNFLFRCPNASIGDDLLKPFNVLYGRGKQKSVQLATLDTVADLKTLDALLFIDFPDRSNRFVSQALSLNVPKYLILFESQIIKPDNWKIKNHALFKKIFTWNDDLIDNERYFKINFSHLFPEAINKISSGRKLCTLIAGNKKISHPLELYSKRMEAIRWFEKHHPGDFEFFGRGWDSYCFSGPLPVRALNRITLLTRFFAPHFRSFRGAAANKKDVYARYRFAICYENARDIPGYITEKIFDCFFAGCVPVYWGASNVTDHIPAECFIDKRMFDNYESLYDYLKNMSDKKYMSFLDNIELFLKSKKACLFSADAFADTVVHEMMRG